MHRTFCLIIFSISLIFAFLPKFEDAGLLSAGGSEIDIEIMSPCVHDWDEDGKKDFILGLYDYGKVNLYLNSGTNSDPVLDAPTYMQADGADIAVSYG